LEKVGVLPKEVSAEIGTMESLGGENGKHLEQCFGDPNVTVFKAGVKDT